MPFIRDYLMDSYFIKEGLISRDKLDAYLQAQHVKDGEAIRAILRMVDMEAWARAWKSTSNIRA